MAKKKLKLGLEGDIARYYDVIGKYPANDAGSYFSNDDIEGMLQELGQAAFTPGGSKVAVDVAATPDYLGNAYNNGALRVDNTTIAKTDGGNYVTLSVIPGGISHTDIDDIGTNTHAQIDTHIADATIHFEMLDEDDMASNDDTKTATQQSIKAYVDAQIGGVNEFSELTDVTGAYTNAYALYRTNATTDGLEETTLLLTEPGANQFQLAAGTSALLVQGDLTVESASLINQDLTSDASPTFAGLTLTGLEGVVQASAGVLSASTALADGTTATTQAASDNSTKVATTAYVDGALHSPITLDANADTLLSLSTQELGLDTQVANTVFAGPASGVDAVPTFRALTSDDIPDLSALYEAAGAVGTHESTYNHANYNTAYGWGDHAAAGYVKADGTVHLTADWDVGDFDLTANSLTLDGTFTDGTASLTAGSLTGVKLGSLVDNGFVKTSGGDGTLSVDTADYVDKTGDTMTGDLTTTDVIKTRSSSFTYNADGTVATIVKASGRTLTFTYNADGTVNTIADGTYTKTFAYNADGTVSTITVT